MASPFPGMDPYLEGELWQEFHERLAHQISSQLMPLIAPKYVALLARRYVFDRPGLSIMNLPPDQRIIYPDVHVAQIKEPDINYQASRISAPTLELQTPMEEEVPILSIEIRDVAERRLVGVIEILSPVNKRGQGMREYLDKRNDLMKTETHLLEIDLLRAGNRLPLAGKLPLAPYFVFLSRFTHRPVTEVWAIQLNEQLPVVPVPLLPPDEDVPLDLQAGLTSCYESVGYQRLLDYMQSPPLPSFSTEELAWIKAILHSAQVRFATG